MAPGNDVQSATYNNYKANYEDQRKINDQLAMSWNILKERESLLESKIFFLENLLKEIRSRVPEYIRLEIDRYIDD